LFFLHLAMFKKISLFPLIIVLAGLVSCKKNGVDNPLFSLQDNSELGINFINKLNEQDKTNVFTFRNYYNGGGVAIGDINNDGLK
jgi:hypothetical protein